MRANLHEMINEDSERSNNDVTMPLYKEFVQQSKFFYQSILSFDIDMFHFARATVHGH